MTYTKLLLCVITVASIYAGERSLADIERPNIIFLMTDDQRWDSFGCYGRDEFRTDHIDRLAKEGVTFDAAFYAVSICMPSRATTMTGQYLSRHKCGFTYPSNYTLSKKQFENSYPAQLKRAGYRTGFIGKLGFAVTHNRQQGNRIKGYNFYKNLAEFFDFFAGDGVHFDKGRVALWPRDDDLLKKIHRKDRPANERVIRTGDAILHFLDTQPSSQPFCLSVSFFGVKNGGPKTIYPEHYSIFSGTRMSVPDNWVEGANGKLPKVVRENWRGVSLHKRFHDDQIGYQNLVRNFAAQGYSVDQQVGRMVAKLKSKGLLENTVIIYTSDNGRFHGCHGLHDKALLYEESVKAPLIVFDGRVPIEKRGRRDKSLISSVDIAPTIVSIAGLGKEPSMQGRDFSGLLDKSQDMDQWRDMVYFENLFLNSMYGAEQNQNVDILEKNTNLIANNRSYRCRGIRTDRWKYFIYYEHRPVIEELYDLKNDPNEQKNLAHDIKHQDMLVSLRDRCNKYYLGQVQ